MFTIEQEFFEQMIDEESPMSQLLISRTTERAARGAERSQITAMTCDIPVVGAGPAVRRRSGTEADVCRPSGRAPRRIGSLNGRRERSIARDVRRVAPVERPRSLEHRASARPVRRRSNIDAVFARRRLVGALVLGLILAGVVWIVTIIGSSYEDAATPGTPSVTQVVHVRSGESLSDVARRIADDLPVAGVVEQLRELNHLESSGLRVGQPLVAPAY